VLRAHNDAVRTFELSRIEPTGVQTNADNGRKADIIAFLPVPPFEGRYQLCTVRYRIFCDLQALSFMELTASVRREL